MNKEAVREEYYSRVTSYLSSMTFTTFPVLGTERLLLRQLSNNDTADVEFPKL